MKNSVRVIRGLALTGVAALGLTAANANAQSVDVDIVVGGGGIAILNYYDAIEVEIDSAELAELANPGCTLNAGVVECSEGASGTLTASEVTPGELSADGALDVTGGGSDPLENVTLDLDNVWAVRAFGGGANTTVAVALDDGDLTGAGGTITVNSVLVYSDTVATPAASVNFPDPGLSAANAELGGVRLDLDMTGITDEGTFSAAGDTYTITVTNS